MLIRFLTASLAIAACVSFALSLGAAQAQSVDPTAPDAVIEYGGPDPLTIETLNGPVVFTVEVANTEQSRERGMMHRESLADDAGMLFDFEQPQFVSIWMENTLISLDIVFIRGDGRIAKIVTGAQPMSRRTMPSDMPVLAVLELRGGRTLELGIEPGDRVVHPLFDPSNAENDAPAAQDVQEDR